MGAVKLRAAQAQQRVEGEAALLGPRLEAPAPARRRARALERVPRGRHLMGFSMEMFSDVFRTFGGPFSAIWTATIARLGALSSVFKMYTFM